jgi:hypothetical protein
MELGYKNMSSVFLESKQPIHIFLKATRNIIKDLDPGGILRI